MSSNLNREIGREIVSRLVSEMYVRGFKPVEVGYFLSHDTSSSVSVDINQRDEVLVALDSMPGNSINGTPIPPKVIFVEDGIKDIAGVVPTKYSVSVMVADGAGCIREFDSKGDRTFRAAINETTEARASIVENVTRIELEKDIVRALIEELDAAGFVPVKVWDGEEQVKSTTVDAVLEDVFAVDDTPTIHFAPKDNPKDWGNYGVMVVPGNGADLISDHHCGNAAFEEAVSRAADRIVETVSLKPRAAALPVGDDEEEASRGVGR